MKVLLYILLAAVGIILLLVLAAVVKTLITPAKKSEFVPKKDAPREEYYAKKLSEMVKCETVSKVGDPRLDRFEEFHKVLAKLFPLVHNKLDITDLDGNLIYYWKGQKSDKPVVLMAHQDVVAAEGEWKHEPFSGDIEDGKVWGRGSADTKCSLCAFLQAVEELLEKDYTPKEDIYLCTSCTEEIGGDGAPKIVAELKKRGVKPYLVCDEGGAIVEEPIGGIKGYYGMIGVLEKGHGNVLFSAKSNGGHSSTPPANSPIARLSKLVCDIEKHNPMTSAFEPETEEMFARLASYGPFVYRLLFGNLWLFKPLIIKLMPSISPAAAALLRTTIAFTVQSGSDGYNVLPQEAKLIANLRYIPHQKAEASHEVLRKLAAKYDIEMTPIETRDACEPVSIGSDAFHLVEDVVKDVFPNLPTCPYVMTGGTDARFYQEICDACIRFSPVLYGPDQMKGMHGLNENLDTVSLPGAVDFYKAIIDRVQ